MSFSKSFGWRFLQPLRLRGSQIPRGPTEGPFQLAVLTMGEIWGDHMEMICGSNGDIVYVDVVYIYDLMGIYVDHMGIYVDLMGI